MARKRRKTLTVCGPCHTAIHARTQPRHDGLGQLGVTPSDVGDTARSYLDSFKVTIGADTKDVQRNIIGERGLGLPRF